MHDLVAIIRRQKEFSFRTFGPGARSAGVVAHIRKECDEVEADPSDVFEWADIIILAIDGAWRAGHPDETIAAAVSHKQAINESRTWPDWRHANPNSPIEHVREKTLTGPVDNAGWLEEVRDGLSDIVGSIDGCLDAPRDPHEGNAK